MDNEGKKLLAAQVKQMFDGKAVKDTAENSYFVVSHNGESFRIKLGIVQAPKIGIRYNEVSQSEDINEGRDVIGAMVAFTEKKIKSNRVVSGTPEKIEPRIEDAMNQLITLKHEIGSQGRQMF